MSRFDEGDHRNMRRALGLSTGTKVFMCLNDLDDRLCLEVEAPCKEPVSAQDSRKPKPPKEIPKKTVAPEVAVKKAPKKKGK
jgi:hypothetical protein